jgi:hypothetical protein
VTYPQLPDAEAALVGFLTAHSVLAPLHGGRVSTELQSDLVCMQVTALGGPQPWPWESAPEFQVSSWGGTKAEASTLDRAARSAVFELLGTAVTGGRVTSVAVRLAGLWTPAEDTNRPRYRSDFALTVMP